jgi:hypothetical protein
MLPNLVPLVRSISHISLFRQFSTSNIKSRPHVKFGPTQPVYTATNEQTDDEQTPLNVTKFGK